MEAINHPSPPPPHVLIFPCPAQGHVNVMLKLAELLSLAGLHVTFLNCENIHDRLLRFTNIESRFKKYPGFRLQKIPDGLPENHPRVGYQVFEIMESMRLVSSKILKQMLLEATPPITCVISDGILGFVLDVAVEVGIPVIYFRTISSSCMWVYFCLQDLIQAGELPIRGEEDMDRLITKVPGMEAFLRCRDLTSFCRVSDMSDTVLQSVMKETQKSSGARALILNTFEDLEGPILAHIRTRCPTIFSIGPIHQNLKLKLKQESNDDDHSSNNNNNLWAVDRTSIDWLDDQAPKSVIYVSFGSITVLKREQLFEFWYGLVNSKKRFLWVMRPGSIEAHEAQEGIPAELEVGTRERGCMVGWVPQEEVLGHKAVGGFLTHSGWNSTLESIVAGVPMICWPYFADQQVNSRFASEVWGLGLDMKDVCDRNVVEKMVNDLMVDRKDEFERSAAKMALLARNSVSEGGSSYRNLERLILDIKRMSIALPPASTDKL